MTGWETLVNVCLSPSEKAKFSLKGAQNKERRFTIYRFLLVHFTDAQRFNITIKISQNILGKCSKKTATLKLHVLFKCLLVSAYRLFAPLSLSLICSLCFPLFRCVSASTPSACFVDGELPLDGDGAAVLAETFGILSLKEIKPSALSGAAGAGGKRVDCHDQGGPEEGGFIGTLNFEYWY